MTNIAAEKRSLKEKWKELGQEIDGSHEVFSSSITKIHLPFELLSSFSKHTNRSLAITSRSLLYIFNL